MPEKIVSGSFHRLARIPPGTRSGAMDKRTKKKIQALNQRLQKLRQQLAGARQQADDPAELESLKKEVAEVEAAVAKLRGP